MKSIGSTCLFLCLVIASACFLFHSCRYEERFYDGEEVMVEFSRDTVRFDTVFTTVGSATRSFKIKNPFDQDIRLSRVFLEELDQSFFRINVNGRAGQEVPDISIGGKDSIYVFVEVTIDPDLPFSVSPFIIEERIIIEVNGNTQDVHLEAWGQNANYIPNNTNKGGLALLSCSGGTVIWDDPRPYVVYGILLIDSCTLQMPPGCKVYVHGGIASRDDLGTYNDGRIIVLKEGKLQTAGIPEDPVIIQGDRLEPEYEGVAAQWSGIQILAESKDNRFANTLILDGITGLSIDSAATAFLNSTQIYNHASRALVTFHPELVQIENSLFHSTSSETVLFKYGGRIEMVYSTITSYTSQKSAVYADNYRCTDPVFCFPVLMNPLDLRVKNCIIAGSGSDELELVDITDKTEAGALLFSFDHSLIRMDTLLNSRNYPNFFDRCQGCATIRPQEPLFINAEEEDFHLDSLSQAEMMAIPIPGIIFDLEGKMRDSNSPDSGCYESDF